MRLILTREIALVQNFFQALRNKNLHEIDTIFSEDADYRIPHAPEGLPNEIIGRRAIHKMLDYYNPEAARKAFLNS